MDGSGLWSLFFATGLPEAYLAIREREAEGRKETTPPAFGPTDGESRPV